MNIPMNCKEIRAAAEDLRERDDDVLASVADFLDNIADHWAFVDANWMGHAASRVVRTIRGTE